MPFRTTTIVAALLLSTAMACRAAPVAPADDPVIHYRSGPGHFAIPQSLFLGGEHPPDGGTDDGALLLLAWPGLQGTQQLDDALQVLLMPLEKGDNADSYLKRKIRVLTRPLQNLPRYFDPQPLSYGLTAGDDRTVPHGPELRRIVNAHPLPGSSWSEIYVDDPDQPDTTIACAPLRGKDLNSTCIQQFVTDELSVQVTYPRTFVADWAIIRQKLSSRIGPLYRKDAP